MWKTWVHKPIDKSRQLQDWVQEAAHSGTATARSMLGSLPFCASLVSSATPQDGAVKEDIVHYFLIPCGIDESGYTLFSKRQLPEGIGTENDLPKFYAFHLPNEGADRKLEELVLRHLSMTTRSTAATDEEPIEARLERIAEEIEKQSNKVTMGIVIIGGVVAVANPLLGVGIAAHALFPSLGAVVSAEAMKIGGSRIRRWRKRGEEKRSAKEAKGKLKQRKVRMLVNPFLARLQYAIDTNENSFDPSMEDPFLREDDGFPTAMRSVTIEVLSEYYEQIESARGDHQFGPEDQRWLNMLHRYAKSESSGR